MKSNGCRKRKEVRDKMKIFDVDVSVKYIVFKIDGHHYIAQFRENKRKGIYDIDIFENGRKKEVEIELKYPPLKSILKEIRRIYIPNWLRGKIKEFQHKYNRES